MPSEQILADIRARIGASASTDACSTALAAASGCGKSTAAKACRGKPIRAAQAKRLAQALAEWGSAVTAGDLAIGDTP